MESQQHRITPLQIAGSILWAVLIAGMQFMLWLLWFFALLKGVGPLEILAAEHDMSLPLMVQQLFAISYLVTCYWYILVLVGFPLAVVEMVSIVAARTSQRRWIHLSRYLFVFLGTVVPLALLAWTVIALTLQIHMVINEFIPMP